MEETKTTVSEFLDRLRKIEDPAAIVVTTHLFCEHAINRLLLEKKKTGNKYIKDKSSFLIRLDLCFNMGLISDEIFYNLIKLNDLRNKCAHNLYVDYSKIDHNYHMFNINEKIDKIPNINGKLHVIAAVTFGALHNYLKDMNISL